MLPLERSVLFHFMVSPLHINVQVKDGWKYDFGLACIPSVILLVGFYFCPESPRWVPSAVSNYLARWLVQVGRVEEAKAVLARLRRKTDAVDQVTQMNFERFEQFKQFRSCKRLSIWWERTGRSRPSLRAAPSGICTLFPWMACLIEFLVSRVWKDSNVRKALLVGCSLQLF